MKLQNRTIPSQRHCRRAAHLLASLGILILGTLVAMVGAPGAAATERGLGRVTHLSVQADQKRFAVVVGNAGYQGMPLSNPVNDVRAMADALAKTGFEVDKLEDANKTAIRSAVRQMADRLRDQGGAGLFYFAGHGVQYRGENYLLPVGENIKATSELRAKAIHLDWVLDELEHADNHLNIVVLDACRNNPLPETARSVSGGIGKVSPPTGVYYAFSTSEDEVALDGAPKGGSHSVFTKHLLAHMHKPGLEIDDLFRQVRAAVQRETGEGQITSTEHAMVGKFYFLPPEGPGNLQGSDLAAAASALGAGDFGNETEMWRWTRRQDTSSAYQEFLNVYPHSKLADRARKKLAKALEREQSLAAAKQPKPAEQSHGGTPTTGEASYYLTQARAALAATRLTTPAHDNAVMWANRVLATDTDNADAKVLLGQVVDRYIELAQEGMRNNRMSTARGMVNKGLSLAAHASQEQLNSLQTLEKTIPATAPRPVVATRSVRRSRAVQKTQSPPRKTQSQSQNSGEALRGFADVLHGAANFSRAVQGH